MWDKSKSAFDDGGAQRRIALLRILIATNYEQCESMVVYVKNIMSTVHKLRGAGTNQDDDLVGSFLLAGMSERFDPMVMVIENSGVKIT